MPKEMLINVSEGEECRIALLENGRLEELYMERTSATSHVGNIYKGRVTNVEASIQAAFVDFGLGRNGFLHISDLMPSYFGRGADDFQESVGRKMARRDRPPIQRCLRRGDEIIVQIIKEGIGTKGPTLSTYISIPGRILVMMPGMAKFGVSRKIEDEDERRRLRQILDSLKPIDDVGFIIRTAGIGKTKAEIQRDLTYLTRLWQNIEKKRQEKAPVELYTEGDLVTRTVRDVFSTDLDRIVVDSEEVAKRIKEFFKIAMPRAKNRIELYEGPVPLFHQAGIERELEQMYSRHVPLPSGGSLVIDSTEAVVAIDVNSGKFRDHNDAEMTAFKTDMEAADEIPRQLKLRDLGGVIICDFIDLRYERHQRELEKRLHDNFKNDRAKTKVLRMSQFGIIELTRQRMRPSLKHSIYFDCPHCKGAGLVKTPESMSLDVMRRLAIAAHDPRVNRIELTVCPDVGVYVLNKKRQQLTDLESHARKRIVVRQDITLGLDEVKIQLFDARDGSVHLQELGMEPRDQQDDSRRKPIPQGRQNSRDRRPTQGRPLPASRTAPPRGAEGEDERDDLDSAEDAVEDRELSRELPAPSEMTGPIVVSQPPPVVPRLPIGKVQGRVIEIDDDIEEEHESSVIEVDEPHEPLGDGPEPYEEDNYDRNRSRDSRDRDSRDSDSRNRDSRDRGSRDGGSRDRDSRDRDSRGRDSRDRGPADRGANDRGSFDRQNRGGPPRPQQGRPPMRPPLNPPRNMPVNRPVINGPIQNGPPMNEPALNEPGFNGPPQEVGGPGQPGDMGPDGGEGGPRRRRRRRGRRGRGGRGEQRLDPQGNPIVERGQEGGSQSFGEGHPDAEAAGEHGDSADAFNRREEPELPHDDEHRGNTVPPEPVGDETVGTNSERLETIFDNEDAESDAHEAAAAAGESAPASDETPEAPSEEGAPKKRRRRRGGRRHRRRGEGTAGEAAAEGDEDSAEAEATPPAEVDEAPAETPAPEPVAEVTEEAPAKAPRRRRAAAAAKPRKTAKPSRKAPAASAAPTPEPVATPVVRSGSTDRHLVLDDIPVDPEPVRRPRSARDLDAVPDDFD
jgi:ribonuclease E